MEKKEEVLSKENVLVLNQLAKSLEEAEKKLEIAYEEKDYEKFNEAKKLMIMVQEKISEILK